MLRNSYSDKWIVSLIFILFLTALVFVVMRNYGLYPMVFSDELSYSKFARIAPFSEASLPNYLYYLVYQFTDVCGRSYLECSRVVNLAFYILALPFVYLIGRMTCGIKLSAYISLLSFVGASNSYTAYFMPESMYYFFFWVVSWLALRINSENGIMSWATLGISVGIASLAKPHALFLLPAMAAYAYYVISGFGIKSLNRSAKAITTLVISTILIKLILGFILAGRSGVTLFGNFYAPYAESAVSSGLSHYTFMAYHTLFSFLGHAIAISLIYGVPLVILFNSFVAIFTKRINDESQVQKLTVYTMFVVFTLVIISALYTASISDKTPGNHLHVRYYFFALPLLFLVAASNMNNSCNSYLRKIIVAAPFAFAIFFVMMTNLNHYEMYSSTAPELYGVVYNKVALKILSSLALLMILVWVASGRSGVAGYLFLFAPLMCAISLCFVSQEMMGRKEPDIYDKAGIFARDELDQSERNSSVIVGDKGAIGGLFRALFYLDTPNLNYLEVNTKDSEIFGIDPNSDFNPSEVSPDKKYLIILGNHRVIGETQLVHCEPDFCIRKIIP